MNGLPTLTVDEVGGRLGWLNEVHDAQVCRKSAQPARPTKQIICHKKFFIWITEHMPNEKAKKVSSFIQKRQSTTNYSSSAAGLRPYTTKLHDLNVSPSSSRPLQGQHGNLQLIVHMIVLVECRGIGGFT